MGVPTSEVGYTSATTGKGDHDVYKGHVVPFEETLLFAAYLEEIYIFTFRHLLGHYSASSGNLLPTFRIHLQMGQTGCPERWVINCHYSGRNNPEKCSSQLLCGGRQKSS